MNDFTMMAKVLDIECNFEKMALKNHSAMEIFAITMMCHAMEGNKAISLPKHFCNAVKQVTTPERLSKIQSPGNQPRGINPDSGSVISFNPIGLRFDLSERFKQQAQERERAAEDSDDSEDENAPIGNTDTDRIDMIKELELMYELIDSMPSRIRDFAGITQEEQTAMRYKVGGACLAIKVADFAKTKRFVRLAFVGGESVGKSTLINRLVSNGADDDGFMPVDTGMCTQIPCIISHGDMEKCALTVDSRGSAHPCSVVQRIQRASQEMKEGKAGKLKKVDAFLATKPFQPPRNVELVDVPGVSTENREHTELQTHLALWISDCIVICANRVDATKRDLRDAGSPLSRLFQIIRNLDPQKPVLCAVTRGDANECDEKVYQELFAHHYDKRIPV